MKLITKLVAISTLLVVVSMGCETTNINSMYGRAKVKNPDNIQLSDDLVLSLASDIELLFANRMEGGWIARRISATIRMVSIAAIGGIGVSAHAERELKTGLALTAGIIPGLQRIWQAAEDSGAYRQGLVMISDAVSDYGLAIATAGEVVNNDSLSVSGAKLFKRVSSTLAVVTDTISGNIPRLKDHIIAEEGVIRIP